MTKSLTNLSPQAQANGLLLVGAAIWGFAFVAQRAGMEHVGPFSFNAIRFALGGMVLVPIILRRKKRDRSPERSPSSLRHRRFWLEAIFAGLFLFGGSTFQQMGMVYTTAGKAGFITGLYVVMVPIIGLLWHQRVGGGIWVGATLSAVGLYLLSMRGTSTLAWGDLLVLLGAVVWAGHVLVIGWLSPKHDPFRLAFLQFMTVSVLSSVGMLIFEEISWKAVSLAAVPILYAGLMSVGAAFTIQVVAQKVAKPAHAAIIMSLEAVFAAIGGWLILGEVMPTASLLGCGLMLTGMIVSQLRPKKGSGAFS